MNTSSVLPENAITWRTKRPDGVAADVLKFYGNGDMCLGSGSPDDTSLNIGTDTTDDMLFFGSPNKPTQSTPPDWTCQYCDRPNVHMRKLASWKPPEWRGECAACGAPGPGGPQSEQEKSVMNNVHIEVNPALDTYGMGERIAQAILAAVS